ncbi:hypothetical protein [Pseudomonas citronellolis]|uniref:hypothetical protein n=1 Tax=Pseudomonas citronellolis TaxID=53408 RepID=UPI00389B2627
MKLNSAREAWHSAFYSQSDGQWIAFEQQHYLGCMVQMSERDRSTLVAMHQALAGPVQSAIATLPVRLQAFGHHMYGPGTNPDIKEEAESLVFDLAYSRGEKMYAKKMERARAVAAGVLYRYRRMHQGGQSSMPDPMPKPEGFRTWILAEKGISLSSEQWTREWEGFIDACFLACDDLDKQALVPVSSILALMKEEA